MEVMRVTARRYSVASFIFWTLAALATWANVASSALVLEVGAAVATTALAGAYRISYALRDRDKDALVQAMADFTQRRVSAPTRPEYRLHVVGGTHLR